MDAVGVSATKANVINTVLQGTSIESKAFKAFTHSGTVVGAIAGGVPAIYKIGSNFINGKSQDWRDWASFGLAGLGVASEFTGLGEAWDGTVGVGIAAGSLGYDIWDATHPEKK
jgi:hypothetical protein